MNRTASHDTTMTTCHTQTTWRTLSPPIHAARPCSAVPNGP